MAKARKLPSGSWRVQASVVVDGKLVRKSFTDTDKKKAEAAATQWQFEKEENSKIEKITLSEAYERYIASKENVLSPSTIRNYKKMHKNNLQDIMQIKINKLTPEQIQRSINLYSADHSPKSVRNCHGLLSAVLRMFRPSMTLYTRLPQKEKKQMYIPSDNDIQKLFNASKNTNFYIPILLAAFGGLREGEICALTSDDVHGNYVTVDKSMVCDSDGKWLLKPPKTFSSNRNIELPDFVINELKDKKGKIVTYNPHSLSMGFNKLLKKHNIPHFRFHDLRHYYVSSLHALNIPDKYIMEQGGWATNYTMQNVYNHTFKNKSSEFSKKISNHFETLTK